MVAVAVPATGDARRVASVRRPSPRQAPQEGPPGGPPEAFCFSDICTTAVRDRCEESDNEEIESEILGQKAECDLFVLQIVWNKLSLYIRISVWPGIDS